MGFRHELEQLGLTLFRLLVGVVFTLHGGQKLFVTGIGNIATNFAKMGIPAPGLGAALVTFAEFLCGIALILGLFTRLAALPLIFAMFVAIAKVHWSHGFIGPGGFEYPLTLMIANLMFLLTGPGKYSVDAVIFRKREAAPSLRQSPPAKGLASGSV